MIFWFVWFFKHLAHEIHQPFQNNNFWIFSWNLLFVSDLVKAVFAWNERVLIIHLLFETTNLWKNLENSGLVVSKFVIIGFREYDIKFGNILRYCSPVINQMLFLQNIFEPIVDTKKWELLLSAAVNPIDKVSFWRNLWDTGYWISSGGLNSVPLEFTGKKVLTPVI